MENRELIKKIVEELKKGKDVTRQLQIYLNVPSCSRETQEMLVQKILSSFENSLSMLNFNSISARDPVPYPAGVATGMLDSPVSLSGSPQSEDSDRDFKDQDPNINDSSRKRKSIGRRKQQVRVSPGMGLEGPLDDGFSWRKYGQKGILGAKYPRGYYRCTHGLVEGCLATKQVQRSDQDPTIFEITYCGMHTCTQNTQIFSPSQPPENQEPKHPQQIHQKQQLSQELLFNLRSGPKVITQDLEHSLIQFPSTSNNIVEANQRQVFSNNDSVMAGCFMANFSQSGTNLQNSSIVGPRSLDERHISTITNASLIESSYTSSVRDHTRLSLAATNSPTIGLDFEFEPNFSFGNSGFLP